MKKFYIIFIFQFLLIYAVKSQILKIYINDTRVNCKNICSGSQVHPFSNFIMGFSEASKIYQKLTKKPSEMHFILIGNYFSIFDIDVFNYTQTPPLELLSDLPYYIKIYIYPKVCELSCTNQQTEISLKTDFFTIVIPKYLLIAHILITGTNLRIDPSYLGNNLFQIKKCIYSKTGCCSYEDLINKSNKLCYVTTLYYRDIINSYGISFFKFGNFSESQELYTRYLYLRHVIDIKKYSYYYTAFILLPDRNPNQIKITFYRTNFYQNVFPNGIISGSYLKELIIAFCYQYYYNQFMLRNAFKNFYYSEHFEFTIETIENARFQNNFIKQNAANENYVKNNGGFFKAVKNSNLNVKFMKILLTEKFFLNATNSTFYFEKCLFEISDRFYPWNDFTEIGIFNFYRNNKFKIFDSIFLNQYKYLINPTKYYQYILNFLPTACNNSIKIIKLKITDMVNFGIVKSSLSSLSNNFLYFDTLEINIYSIYFKDEAIINLSNFVIVLKNVKITKLLKLFIESNYNQVFLCDSEIFDKNILFKSTYSVIIMKNLTFKNQYYSQPIATFSLGDHIILYQNRFENLIIFKSLLIITQVYQFFFVNNVLKNININRENNFFHFTTTIIRKIKYIFFINNDYERIFQSTYNADFFVFQQYVYVKILNERISYLKYIGLLVFDKYSLISMKNLTIENIYTYRTTIYNFGSYSKVMLNFVKFEKITSSALGRLFYLSEKSYIFIFNFIASQFIVNEITSSCSGCSGNIMKIYYANKIYLKNVKIENVNMKTRFLETGLFKFYSFNYLKFDNVTINNVMGISGNLIELVQSNFLLWKNIIFDRIYMPTANLFQLELDNKISLKNITLTNITSSKGGCAIVLDKTNYLLIEDLFSMNISDISRSGGGFLTVENLNYVIFKKVYVNMLTVVNQGGFIYAKIKNLIKIISSSFKNFMDLTNISGGLFSKINSFNTLIIIGCEFIKFFENESGNLVFANEFNFVVLNNLTMVDCNADSINFGGGAITLIAFNHLFLQNCSFFNVTSIYGAFIFLQAKNVIFLENFIIHKNNKMGILSLFKVIFNNHVLAINCSVNLSLSEKYEMKIFELNYKNVLKIKNSQFIFDRKINLLKNYAFFLIKYNQLILQKIELNNVKKMIFVDCINSFVYVEYLNLVNITFLEFKLIESTKSKIKIKNLKISIDNLQNNLINSFDSFCVLEKLFLETKKSKKKIHSNIIYGKNSHFYLKNFNFVSNYYSKNFLELKNSSIQINNCLFGFNNIVYNGAIINFEKFIKSDKKYKNFEIKKSIFLHNSGIEGSNLFLNITNYNEKIIENNIFIGNKAKKGGIIYSAFFTDIIFTKNKFVNSFADKGGFMYLDKITFESYKKNSFFNYLNSNKTFKNNIFFNQKSIIGGLIFYNTFENLNLNLIQIIKKFSNKIKYNSLIKKGYSKYYGNLFATNPFKIYLEFVASFKYFDKNFSIFQKNLKYFENCIFYLKPFDIFGNIAFGTENYFYDLLESNITIKNLLKKNENLLFCMLGNITRSKLDQKEINFFINNYISVYKNESKTIKNNFKFDKYNIKFIFSGNCQIGERLTDLFSCVPCEKNQYSFNRDFSQISGACHPCDSKFNCFGGFNLTPKAGYSRLSKYSIKFSACPNPTACLGDNRENLNVFDSKYEIGICEKEYRGIFIYKKKFLIGDFCSECSNGFGKSDLHTCVPCAKSFSYIKLTLFIIFKLFILLYYGHKSINMAFVVISKDYSLDEVISTYLIKILTNHFQMIFLITFYQYESPAIIDDIFSFFTVVSDSSSQISFECILKSVNIDIPSIFFILVIICLELLLMIAIGFVYVKYSKKGLLQYYSVTQINTILCIAIIFVTFSYSQFLNIVSKTFMCINLGDELIGSNYRLINDYSIECFKGIHLYWIQIIVGPIVLGIIIVFPLLILTKLFLIRKKVLFEDRKNLFQFGFLYVVYKNNFYFWEIIILLKKICLIIMNIIFLFSDKLNSVYQVLIYILIIIIFLLANLLNPYKKEFVIIYNLENKSFISIICSFYVVLFALKNNYNIKTNKTERIFLGAFSFCLQFIFLLPWIRQYFNKEIIKKFNAFKNSIYNSLKKSRVYPQINSKRLEPAKKIEYLEVKKKMVFEE